MVKLRHRKVIGLAPSYTLVNGSSGVLGSVQVCVVPEPLSLQDSKLSPVHRPTDRSESWGSSSKVLLFCDPEALEQPREWSQGLQYLEVGSAVLSFISKYACCLPG